MEVTYGRKEDSSNRHQSDFVFGGYEHFGCSSKDSESSTNAVMGRVTSVSDTQIVMEVMDKQDDKSRKQQVEELPESRGINCREPHRWYAAG